MSSSLRPGALTRRSVIMLAGAALLGASALSFTAGPVFAADQILKIAHPAIETDWSPLRGGGPHFRWNSLWFASPMYFDAKGEIHPYVFSTWKSNADGSVWTFEIDPKATFSDGSPITAADVKGSWELSTMPSTKNQRVDQVLSTVAGYTEVSGGKAKELSGVKVTGDKSLEVTLAQPDPIFFMKVANHIAPIVKVAQARNADGEEVAEWWSPDNGVVVSGPFKPESMNLDTGDLVFKPNENFFGPKPKLTEIDVKSVEDSVTATALLQKGEFNAHTELITPTVIADLGKDFLSGPVIPTGQHFWLNVKRAPTDDVKVRQALIMAIDRDGLIKASFPDGPHQKADQILNAVSGVDPKFEPYPFDPAKAKALLAESSYGGPERLPKLMIVGVSSPATEAAAQYIAEQWRQNLGITAVEMKPQIDNYAGPDQASVQIFRDDVGTRVPDAVAYLKGVIYSGASNAKNKLGGYANPEIDKLLDAGGALAIDNPERNADAQKAQKLFRDDYAYIPWYYQAMSKWATPEVKGLEKNLDWQVVEPWAITIE